MAVLDPIQRNRLVQLFPELPAQHAENVLLHILGVPLNTIKKRRGIETCKRLMGVGSIHELRCIVLARILLSKNI
jgi:hypothetical protein